MQERALGTEGLVVSCIGLGCMGMSQSYGSAKERNDNEAIKVVHRGLGLGINFFDTAEVYGPYTNEQLLGRTRQGRRDHAVIATKFGYEIGDKQPYPLDSHPKNIRRACDESLKRLGIDHIDLFYSTESIPKFPSKK